ncbi:hypothetical protein WSM22_26680 [Cytophagales bacterium WSM2-2]|nr:hypothetical protein WSM22_26680 [Cytophagales bacterium WSM2-2]
MKKLIVLLAAALLVQCVNTKEELGDCPVLTAPQISYSVHVYPIVAKTCALPQCHTSDFEHGNFTRYEDLKKKADNGKLRFMIETHNMPHSFTDGPWYLTTCEIETIKKWIAEGAKNN